MTAFISIELYNSRRTWSDETKIIPTQVRQTTAEPEAHLPRDLQETEDRRLKTSYIIQLLELCSCISYKTYPTIPKMVLL